MTTTRPRSARSGRRLRRLTAAGLVIVALTASGCTGVAGGSGGGDEPTGPPVTATILEPADASSGVPTAVEIVFATENAVETTVELTEIDGTPIDGSLTPEGDSWLPDSQLEYETTYVATLTAVGADGTNAITTSTFTTMPEPKDTVRVFSFLGTDATVGVAMPLRIEFKDDADQLQVIPKEHRAEIERRLTVRSEPPQEGSWHWVSPGELHYRPRDFWQPGTQISYRATVGGLPIGKDRYLRNDLNVTVSVGDDIRMEVDNDTRQMIVKVNGEVTRSIPVSLGRSDFPSSSGIFVIMEKFPKTVFDTREELGARGYVVDIEYAMRLTYRGEFIHATPRSGEELGNENVTHGCINMSRDNAEWLFNLTHAWGDPVVVSGTARVVQLGNGWTDWNLSWEHYQRGSELFRS